jgi:hypothetical protein
MLQTIFRGLQLMICYTEKSILTNDVGNKVNIYIRVLVIAVSMLQVAAVSQADSGAAPNAREMFLAARDKASAKPSVSLGARPKVAPPARAEVGATEVAGTDTSQRPQGSSLANAPEVEAKADILKASYSSSPSPLGLRYTIVKRETDRSADVSANTVFHNGDKIQVGVEVSEPGFLYIVTRGSSGTWELLFPSLKIENGDNRVGPKGRYVVPQGYVFAFSGKPGTEKLFIVFSRRTEPEIDNLIYSLQDSKNNPAGEPVREEPAQPELMVGMMPIDDSIVSRLRATYSRDLVIEPVNEKGDSGQPGHDAEHSVYIVNPKGGADSRVVADISLAHE